MQPRINVPQPDQELVALQKADAARATADRVSTLQKALRGQTARTRRRYGVFDLVAPAGGGQGSIAGNVSTGTGTNSSYGTPSAPFNPGGGGYGGGIPGNVQIV